MNKQNLKKSNSCLLIRATKAAQQSATKEIFEKLLYKMYIEDIEALISNLCKDRVKNPKMFFTLIKQLSKCNKV